MLAGNASQSRRCACDFRVVLSAEYVRASVRTFGWKIVAAHRPAVSHFAAVESDQPWADVHPTPLTTTAFTLGPRWWLHLGSSPWLVLTSNRVRERRSITRDGVEARASSDGRASKIKCECRLYLQTMNAICKNESRNPNEEQNVCDEEIKCAKRIPRGVPRRHAGRLVFIGRRLRDSHPPAYANCRQKRDSRAQPWTTSPLNPCGPRRG